MKKILIVDDNKPNLDLLEAVLSPKFEIFRAEDGLVALNLVKMHSPDLVITDYNMPKMDGKTFAQEIRKDKRFCNLPIIFSTASDFVPDTSLLAIACGVPYIMPKPCDPIAVLKTVETVFVLENEHALTFKKDLVIIASDVTLVKKAIIELLERSEIVKEKTELNLILKLINTNINENKA